MKGCVDVNSNQPHGAAPHVTGVRTEGPSRGAHEDEEGQPHSGMEEASSQEHSPHFLSPNQVCHLCSPGHSQQTVSHLWSDCPSISTSWVIRWAPRLPLSEPCPVPSVSTSWLQPGPFSRCLEPETVAPRAPSGPRQPRPCR